MPPTTEPAFYSKPITLSFPAGVVALLVTALVSGGAAGGVGIVTRDGDLSSVDERIEAAVDTVRREAEAAEEADDELDAQRADEVLRLLEQLDGRLDRIERALDER